jgi:hypothetical protein
MATGVTTFADWLTSAQLSQAQLTAPQLQVLEAAFRFRQRCGADYYSTRLLSHFLLHAGTGLPVTRIACLLGLSRSAASAQQGVSSKEVVQAAHHRLAGRAHGKLLPRYAGPIAQFLLEQPRASRYDLLDFIERTWKVRVSRTALHKFLNKYGLEQTGRIVTVPAANTPAANPPGSAATAAGVPEAAPEAILPAVAGATEPPALPVPLPAADFFLLPPSTPAPSCSCPSPSPGSPRPKTALPMTTARSAAAC